MTQEQIVQLIFIILPFVLAVISFLVTKFIIPKLPAQKQAQAVTWSQQAVQAVEQLASTKTAGMSSNDKKTLAIQFVQQLARSAGIALDPQVISTLIESAVFLLNSQTAVLSQATLSANTAPLSSGSLVNGTSVPISPAVPPVSK